MTRVVSIAITAFLATSSTIPAEGGALAKAAPMIRFDSTTHDFGAIPANQKQTFSWACHNDGSSALEIIAMHPSCG